MNLYYKTFQKYLNDLNKEKAFSYSMELLQEGKISIIELYEEILAPALNSIYVGREEEDEVIWKEHLMTNIVRCIVENCYPYVLKEKKKKQNKKVMIVGPEEEYHDLGARMGEDFYNILGYQVYFIGGNTPQKNVISAYRFLQPEIISISVTNYLNLISVKKIINEIRKIQRGDLKIFISGSYINRQDIHPTEYGADKTIKSFKELEELGGNSHETIL